MDRGDLSAIGLAAARALLEPALFDAAFYRGEAQLAPEDDAFAHYFRKGASLRPNPVFDPLWYLPRNPEAAGVCPLLHYAAVGEPADRDPSALFDVAWYRRTHSAERPLAHYLAHRFGPFSPVPEFDAGYYLKTYPDVGAARMDPFLHYMHFGYREFRKPSAGFNPRLYANRHLADDRAANPLAHARAHGAASPQPAPAGPYAAVKNWSRRGPRFEPLAPPVSGEPAALVLAFHLTQFHRIPENDAWWGEGFTEWTQLARGQPRFEGHYQPRIPGGLGFYDLSDPATLRAQAALAKAAGIGGFVFYYYDFAGRRLLEKPLELFLGLPDIDIGFCLMWANENWTRRWDGADDKTLIAQSYDEADEERRAAEFARHFRDPRYIRLDGRPLTMVYRASLIPDTGATLARWRRLFTERFGEDPIFVMAQTFDDLDPRPLGFDGAVEFPPHKLTKGLPQIYEHLEIHDEGFEADAFAYSDLVAASLTEPPQPFPLLKTAVPSWDNDARRQGKGLTLVGSTPRQYERWLAGLIAGAQPFFGRRIVCVNAWNEWSEGAYLEPDVHYGSAYLNATARAAFGREPPKALLAAIGERAAAMARDLAARFGCRVEVFEDAAQAKGAGGEAALVERAADVLPGLRTAWLAGPARDAEAMRRAEAVVFADEAARRGALPLAEPDKLLAAATDPEARERLARALLAKLWPGTISVFLVHAGEPARLAARLRAILAQTHPVLEIFVVDETGSEASLETVEAVAGSADRDVNIILDAASGAIWEQAAKMAAGDFLWIADDDSLADPTFLTTLSAPMRADWRLVLAFCDSRPADARPNPLTPARRPVSFGDRSFEGDEFLARLASPPSPGAMLWRRDALARALASPGGERGDLTKLVRVAAAAPGARVRHIAEALSLVPAPA
jgi:hypothetical protein